MSHNRFNQIVLASTSLLIIFAVVLLWINLASTDDIDVTDTVVVEDGETKILKFENLSLVPGEQCEYTVFLEGDNPKAYDVTLDFEELFDLSLKNFAYVRILADGKLLLDELLADAFKNDSIKLHVDFGQDEDVELKITYYLPIEVGNEAKNAEAIFDLRISASNE